MTTNLIAKYDTAAPRYTSYPTVPYWQHANLQEAEWMRHLAAAATADPRLSLYVHLPYCEQLCTYCGCNKHITRNHRVEQPYIQALVREWSLYLQHYNQRPVLTELHLGGGTPTFFAPDHLRQLIEDLLKNATPAPGADFGFEAHPNSTREEHLKTLFDLGFRRVSIGVQDFDEQLMALVNRAQTAQQVESCLASAREIGYTSVNFDLIFGLPRQTVAHIEAGMEKVGRLMPDRIAFYSYAHVPWLKKSQTAYREDEIPRGIAKRKLYETGRKRLEALGYAEIGMDHFALKTDPLFKALKSGALHRNFMGYTPTHSPTMIGIGASAISDTWTAFAQNEKNILQYQNLVMNGHLPVFRGHILNEEDMRVRRHILDLMTRFQTTRPADDLLPNLEGRLQPFAEDGLIEQESNVIRVNETGRPFLRNICMALDAHFWRRQPEGSLFSASV